MREYTASEKRSAVRAYVTHGTYDLAAQATGIPMKTIAHWKRVDPVWWDREVSSVTLSLLETLTESDQSALRRVRTRVIEQLERRLNEGDQKLNVKTGELVRVEVPAKELSVILTAVGGQIGDVSGAKVKTDEERLSELARLGAEDHAVN